MEYKNFDKEKNWMAVDFDGCLHLRPQSEPFTVLGEPIQPMVDLVKEWLANGIMVRIFTARVSHIQQWGIEDDVELQRTLVEDWCEKYIGQKLEVTNMKDGLCYQIYDDRAVCVERNTGRIIGINKPW